MIYTLVIYVYALAVRLAALFNAKAKLLVKGQAETFSKLAENLEPEKQYLWFHAASLGEFEQGRPLIEKIRKTHPEYKVLLTFFSPSGYEVRKNYNGADIVCYLPFDTPRNAKRFVEMVQPAMAFFIKYEFWYNFLHQLSQNGIPTYSVATILRPTQIFFKPWGRSYARVLHCFKHFFVQNEETLQLLAGIGINCCSVVGDTRFDRVVEIREEAKDVPMAATFVEQQADNVLVAGSTWPPDEEIIFKYFNQHTEQRLIIAPHVVSDSHLQEIEHRTTRPTVRLSQATPENIRQAHCLIIDGYGLLSSIYRYGTMAYVGGGFGVGIHNVPEAAVYGIPVVVGPNNTNFREVKELLALGGTFEIHDIAEYSELMQRFAQVEDFRAQSGQKAKEYIEKGRGAAQKILHEIGL